ncbi:MAG: DUF3089 domain-containing protein [Polyangiales bacterium]
MRARRLRSTPARFACALAMFAMLAILTTCAHAPATKRAIQTGFTSPYDGYSSAHYAQASSWLCRPDRLDDPCHLDLSTTVIRADGSRVVVPLAPAQSPAVDCFYVYPTVDLSLGAANHVDFTDLEPMTKTLRSQVARFASTCAIYAPLYRQVTIGTYLLSPERGAPYLDVAYSDVADAFLHYLGTHNQGRKIVLIGHSQGTHMLTRLLQQYFDRDPVLRDRLLVALVIGGDVEVPKGRVAGGTFESIPVCTDDAQLGCVVAYRTFRAGSSPKPGRGAPKPGNTSVCVHPGDVSAGGPRRLAGTTYGLFGAMGDKLHDVDGITTPFVTLPDLYDARCTEGEGGVRYLEISSTRATGDVRRDPIDLDSWVFGGALGLHVLDYQLPQEDLLALVTARVAALTGK